MKKNNHPVDWYINNTPSDDKEYDFGIIFSIVVTAIVFYGLAFAIIWM